MSNFKSKVLWVNKFGSAKEEADFASHAHSAGVDTVCIRSAHGGFPNSIMHFHSIGLKVFAWRWPAVVPTSTSPHYYALDEAAFVANVLIPAGLDGYVADPESDKAGAENDWDDDSHAPLASQFCSIIKTAAAKTGKQFVFGTTSGCNYPAPTGKPHIPWTEFFAASDILLPQTYWRWTNGHGDVTGINGGTPTKAIDRGNAAWKPKSLGKPIIPMAGELDVIAPAEIAEYALDLVKAGVAQAHFYTDNYQVPPANFAAIKAL